MVTFGVYDPAGTSLGTLSPSSASWRHQQSEDGTGSVTVAGDISSTLLAETKIIRVNDGTADRFAFVPTVKNRRQVEASTELDLSGPGVRWLLHAGQVLQEDTSDCAEPSNTRWLGWMSADYDDSAWAFPDSWGAFVEGPFPTARPEDWVDPLSQFLTPSATALAARDWYARASFTVAAEQDVIVCAAADDEYRLFIDGTEILSTMGGGPYQWKKYQQRPLRMCVGTHTIAAVVRNLQRPSGSSPTWLIAAVVPANTSTGGPEAHNQLYAVYHDHTGGTFTLTVEATYTTSAIAYDANAATVQAALEALTVPGTGNVTVSGSGSVGSPWLIEFDGDLSSKMVTLTGNGGSLTGGTGFEVDEYVRGGAAEPLIRTDDSWVVLDNPTDAPGLTPGEIFRILMSEAQARGTTVLDDFTDDFSDTLDSDGVAWADELTLPVSLPADIHRVSVLIEEHGYPVDVTPALVLQCWNDRGTDLSATVVFTAGTAGVTDINARRDETTIRNAIRGRTDQGWFWQTNSSSITARGRWEDGIDMSGYSSETEARLAVNPILNDLATPPRTTTFTIPSEATDVPYADFDMGDIVSAPAFGTSAFVATDMRVSTISGRLEESSIVWTVEVVD